MNIERIGRVAGMAFGAILLAAALGATAPAAPRPVVGIAHAQSRALAAVPGTLADTTLDLDRGKLVYVVEVSSAVGLRDVDVEAHTGKVLRITPVVPDRPLAREVEAP